MRAVTTVTRDVSVESPSSLGFCHSHEHVFISDGRSAQVNEALRIDDEKKSVEELKDFYAAGGRAVVDSQPIGCNRDAAALKTISEASGVSVIASTGFHKIIFYPGNHWIFRTNEKELKEIFITEMTEGMYTDCDKSYPEDITEIRAGQIKAALDVCGVNGPYEKLFRAAAKSAVQTGRTLTVHIERGANPLMLADYLESSGIDLEHTVFCHMDRAVDDVKVHFDICSRGIFLEYDTICRPKYHDDNREAEIIKQILDAGYEDKILMGLDVTRARLKSYGGTPGLSYILKTFIPLLLERGVSEKQIRKAFYDNPAKAFSHDT